MAARLGQRAPGDGRITLRAAAVGLLVLAVGRGRPWARVVAWLAAAVALATAGYDFVHIRHAAAGAILFGHQVADVGWGPVAPLIGAAVASAALVADTTAPLRLGMTALACGAAVAALIGGGLQHPKGATAAAESIPTIPTIPTIPQITENAQTGASSDTAPAAAGAGTIASTSTGPTDLASLPQQCSSGLAASQSVSCGLASNVFYEYYQATQNGTDTTALSAWSRVTQRYYDVSCSPGNGVISCSVSGTSDPNAEVEFTQAAISAYTPQQASSYAARVDLGPNG